MDTEKFLELYKIPIIFVMGCIGVAVILCIMIAHGPGDHEIVVFSKHGVPHCPYCLRIVMNQTDYCAVCQKSFRWTNVKVKCHHCKGSGECPTCSGISRAPYYDPNPPARPVRMGDCWECTSRKKGKFKGRCAVCNGEGTLRYGLADVRFYDERPDLRVGPEKTAKKSKP